LACCVDVSDGAAGLSGELWDVDRLAAYLGVGRRFVYRLTHERRIRHVKVANQLRFRPEDVAAFLADQTVEPDAGEVPPSPARRGGRPRNEVVW
jgi:excisionase family DNA binding protein